MLVFSRDRGALLVQHSHSVAHKWIRKKVRNAAITSVVMVLTRMIRTVVLFLRFRPVTVRPARMMAFTTIFRNCGVRG